MSDRYDIFGLRAFLTLGYREFDFLTFGQRLEAVTGNRAEMREYVGAGFLFDKAEAFRFVEPFNGSGSSGHNFYPDKSMSKDGPLQGRLAVMLCFNL
jgi:hypothetical protein